jgi:hypothetical protein
MAVIAFAYAEDRIWMSPAWLYENILRDVQTIAKDDLQLVEKIENSIPIHGLRLYRIKDIELLKRILLHLKEVVQAIMNHEPLPGMAWNKDLSKEEEEKTRHTVEKLLPLIIEYENKLEK